MEQDIEVLDQANELLRDLHKIVKALNKHLEKTDCKHCKKLFRNVFEIKDTQK